VTDVLMNTLGGFLGLVLARAVIVAVRGRRGTPTAR